MALCASMLSLESVDGEAVKELLEQYSAHAQETGSGLADENFERLVLLLQKWDSVPNNGNSTPVLKELAFFLSPQKDGQMIDKPPIAIESTPERGDYREYGIDLRVNAKSIRTKEQIVQDAGVFLLAESEWREKRAGRTWFLSDPTSPFKPADEYRFYDFKRERLNQLILGGMLSSVGALGLVLSARIGAFKAPGLGRILTAPSIQLELSDTAKIPYSDDIGLLGARIRGWLLAGIVILGATILTVQRYQIKERKEMWVEGWVNHPASFVVILCFGLVLLIGLRKPSPAVETEFFVEDYLKFFRTFSLILICIPVAAVSTIVYSLGVLLPSDPVRAWGQTVISTGFMAVALLCLINSSRRVFGKKCRVSAHSPEVTEIRLRDHLVAAFIPNPDDSLLQQIISILGVILVINAF